jgi:glutamate racemase
MPAGYAKASQAYAATERRDFATALPLARQAVAAAPGRLDYQRLLVYLLVENGRFRPGDPVIETVAREYLEPLRATGMDTLILGCTHYPLLTEIIADIMGPGVTLIDSGAAAARVLRQTLSDRGALAQRDHGTLTLYASDRPEDFGALAGQFLRRPLESAVQHVDIERY